MAGMRTWGYQRGGLNHLEEVKDLRVSNWKYNWMPKSNAEQFLKKKKNFFLKNQKLPDFQGITNWSFSNLFRLLSPVALISRCFFKRFPPKKIIYLELEEIVVNVSQRGKNDKNTQAFKSSLYSNDCRSQFLLLAQGCAFKAGDRLHDLNRLYAAG